MKSIIILSIVAICAFYQICPVVANDIDDLLEKLEKAVDKAVAEAKEKIEEARAKVNETAKTVEAGAQSLMQGLEDGFEKELDALKEKAKDAGVNIDDCLGADEQKLVNLPTEGTNTMVSCVQGKINKVFDIAEEALTKIQTTVDEIAEIHQEVKDCGHGFHAVKCLAKLAEKITKDIISLPSEIEKVANEAVNLIVNLESEIKECANNAVNTVKTEGTALIEKISLCVAGKIVH